VVPQWSKMLAAVGSRTGRTFHEALLWQEEMKFKSQASQDRKHFRNLLMVM
jgi:hypothetical protein